MPRWAVPAGGAAVVALVLAILLLTHSGGKSGQIAVVPGPSGATTPRATVTTRVPLSPEQLVQALVASPMTATELPTGFAPLPPRRDDLATGVGTAHYAFDVPDRVAYVDLEVYESPQAAAEQSYFRDVHPGQFVPSGFTGTAVCWPETQPAFTDCAALVGQVVVYATSELTSSESGNTDTASALLKAGIGHTRAVPGAPV